MKNERLDELCALAEQLGAAIPSMALRGDGEFIDEDGRVIPRESILKNCYQAKIAANELAAALESEPRRRSPGKDG